MGEEKVWMKKVNQNEEFKRGHLTGSIQIELFQANCRNQQKERYQKKNDAEGRGLEMLLDKGGGGDTTA